MPKRRKGGAGSGQGTTPKSRLIDLINEWLDLNKRIRTEGKLNPPKEEEWRERRHLIADRVRNIVGTHPNLRDFAENQGFTAFEDERPVEGKKGDTSVGGGGGGGGGDPGGGDGGAEGAGAGAGRGGGGGGRGKGKPDFSNHKKLKNFTIGRLPSGRIVAIRQLKIRGNKVPWGVFVDKDDLDKYGIKDSQIKSLSKAHAKRLEVVGNADELQFRGDDKDEFKAIVRGITRSYKGRDVLEDDELLGIFVAQAALGLSDNEVRGLLRATKFYRKSTEYERAWEIDYSNEQRRETIRSAKQDVMNSLEDLYGTDWMKQLRRQGIKTPMKQVRDWAEKIASGEMGGDPTEGLRRFLQRHEDKAREIEGTPAWMAFEQEQEELRRFENRPEDILQNIRGQALSYLGYADDSTPLLSGKTLKGWANDLATGVASEGDWEVFLRKQMKALYPFFDPNVPWQDQVDPYKAMLEQSIGTTVSYADPFLKSIVAKDSQGRPLGDTAMSLFDYAQFVRDNDPRFWDNPNTEERGRQFAQGVLSKMLGVGA